MTDSQININPDFRQIILSGGQVAIIDTADYEYLSKWKWNLINSGYAKRTKNNRSLLMHRVILGIIDTNIICDHLNGDKLDNRRCNLRVATPTQNSINRKGKSGRLLSKGIRKFRNRYFARIIINRKEIALGGYATEGDAIKAYNEAAKKYHGKFAKLNIIKD